MEYYNEEFDNIKDFLHSCKDRPINKVFTGREQASRTGQPSFCQTRDWNEAEKLLTYGWDEHTKRIRDAMFAIDKVDTTEALNKTIIEYNPIGQISCVPRALLGLPDSMILSHKPPTKQRTIRIIYDICAAGNVTGEDMVKAGIAILTAVYHLEKLGFRVRLDISEACANGGYGNDQQILGWRLCAKDYKQPVDITKLAFPCIHPSMLRRMSFAWLERTPKIKSNSFSSGYGTVLYKMGGDALQLYKDNIIRKGEHLIFFYDVQKADYDPITLLRNSGIFYGTADETSRRDSK
jgi:hypothetical protein